VPGGVVHRLPADLRKALIANPAALDAWKDITPLARNEFICWVEDAKQEMTSGGGISWSGQATLVLAGESARDDGGVGLRLL
jgi:Bacteriocin-protection, YdeI or OmpD-Associated